MKPEDLELGVGLRFGEGAIYSVFLIPSKHSGKLLSKSLHSCCIFGKLMINHAVPNQVQHDDKFLIISSDENTTSVSVGR